MATLAGQMQTGSPAGTQWVACDQKVYYALDPKQTKTTPAPGTVAKGTRWDYLRRTGWQGIRHGLGPLGWRFQVPKNATYKVSLSDELSEAGLTPPVPAVGSPPAGTTG